VTTVFNGKEYIHTLYYRNLLQAIRDIVSNPSFADVLALDPERLWMRRPDGEGNMRVYKQYHHSDDMWFMQVCSVVLANS
jgi:hypothetical protein